MRTIKVVKKGDVKQNLATRADVVKNSETALIDSFNVPDSSIVKMRANWLRESDNARAEAYAAVCAQFYGGEYGHD